MQWFAICGSNEQWFSTKDIFDTSYSMHSTWVKGAVIFAIGLNIFFLIPWVSQMSSGFQLKTQWKFSTPCIVDGLNVQWFLAIGSNNLFLFSISGSNEQWFSTKDTISIPYFMHSRWVDVQGFAMCGSNEQWFSTKDTMNIFHSMHSRWVKCAVIFCNRLK